MSSKETLKYYSWSVKLLSN